MRTQQPRESDGGDLFLVSLGDLAQRIDDVESLVGEVALRE